MKKTTNTTNTNLTTAQSTSAIVKNLTSAEVKKAQETAETRYHSFSESFRDILSKRDDITFVRDTSRDAYFRIDALQSHISRKEHKIVLYTTKCANIKERNEVLKLFKDTKHVYTCKTDIYLKETSSEKQLEIIFDNVNTVQCEEAFVKQLIDTVKKCQKLLSDYRKSQKEA
jgi:hypothetical protein